MWILKNSKELLDHLQSPNFTHITNIKSFDLSTLYTQQFLTQSLKADSQLSSGTLLFTKMEIADKMFLVLGCEGPYFVREHSDSKNKYTEDDIINMLEFLVDNIFVVFGGNVFQQIVGIPMGKTMCSSSSRHFCTHTKRSLLSTGKKKLASQFNFTYRYIDDVLSINNLDFEHFLGQMHHADLEIKDTTESNTSASYLDLLVRSGGTVSCALPLTTNVTISTSISQTLRS